MAASTPPDVENPVFINPEKPEANSAVKRLVKWPVLAMKWCVKISSICALVACLAIDFILNTVAERIEKMLDWAEKDT